MTWDDIIADYEHQGALGDEMDVPTAVRRAVQEWLQSCPEDAAVLQGTLGAEWFGACERVKQHVSKTLIREVGWREWLRIQGAAKIEVKQLCKEMRR